MKLTFRRKAAGLLAVMTLSSSLTGCFFFDQFRKSEEIYDMANDIIDQAADQLLGTTDVSTTETTEQSTETTTSTTKTNAEKEKENSTGTNTNTRSRSEDVENARAVLEEFLEACKTGDSDTILKLSNVENMMTLLSDEMDTESFRQELTESFSSLTEFSISNGRYEAGLVEDFNSYMSDLQADMIDSDEFGQQIAEMFSAFFQPIDGVCSFDVTATVDGESETETIYVLHSGDKWQLDLALIPAMTGYVNRANEVKDTAAAKSVYNAANSALTIMDVSNIDVLLLNGELTFRPEDFANVQHIADARTPDQARQEFAYQLTVYASDVKNYDAVSLYIENGVCRFAAVDTTNADGTISSATYPEISDLFDDPELSDWYNDLDLNDLFGDTEISLPDD